MNAIQVVSNELINSPLGSRTSSLVMYIITQTNADPEELKTVVDQQNAYLEHLHSIDPGFEGYVECNAVVQRGYRQQGSNFIEKDIDNPYGDYAGYLSTLRVFYGDREYEIDNRNIVNKDNYKPITTSPFFQPYDSKEEDTMTVDNSIEIEGTPEEDYAKPGWYIDGLADGSIK